MNDEALEINDFDPKLLTALASIHQPLIIATSAPAFSQKLITNGVRKSVADDALKNWILLSITYFIGKLTENTNLRITEI